MNKVDSLGDTLQRLALGLDRLLLEANAPAPPHELHTLRLLATEALLTLREVAEADVDNRHRSRRLDHALRGMTSEFGTSTGCSVDVRIRGEVGRVPHPVSDVVLDIARETFSNISRNARSTVAVLVLSVDDDRVALEIVDDGVDLPQRQVDAWSSTVELGLRRLRRAVASMHGQLAVQALHPRGVRLRAVLPLAAGCPS